MARPKQTFVLIVTVVLLIVAQSAGAEQVGTEGVTKLFALGDRTFGAYDGSSQKARLFHLEGGVLREKGAIPVDDVVTAMVAIPNGYAFATGMGSTGAHNPIRVFKSSHDGKHVEIIFEHPSERNQVTGLVWDGGKLWIDFFESKYFTKIGYLTPTTKAGQPWEFKEVTSMRMGDSFDHLAETLVVGRSYGNSQGEDGDLLLFSNGEKTLLPSYRGVRAVNLFGDPSNPSIVIGDGWHANYGQVAQGRVSLLKKRPQEARYALEIIDWDSSNYSFGRFFVFPNTGKQRIAAVGSSTLVVFTNTGSAWGKNIIYAQTNSTTTIEAILVDSDQRGGWFVICDRGLKVVRFEG